jgi:hypothetical protein
VFNFSQRSGAGPQPILQIGTGGLNGSRPVTDKITDVGSDGPLFDEF